MRGRGTVQDWADNKVVLWRRLHKTFAYQRGALEWEIACQSHIEQNGWAFIPLLVWSLDVGCSWGGPWRRWHLEAVCWLYSQLGSNSFHEGRAWWYISVFSIARGFACGQFFPRRKVLNTWRCFGFYKDGGKGYLLAFNEQGPGKSAIPQCSRQSAHLKIVQISTWLRMSCWTLM